MFRFTIRDALWLTVVVGVGCAWWADRSSQRAIYKRLLTRYQLLEDVSNYVIERKPDGTYDVWDGPRRQPDGTFAYPNRNAPFP